MCPELARAWSHMCRVAAALLEDGVSGREMAAVVSRQLCALTARAAVLAENRMRERGDGAAALRLCLRGAGLGRPRRKPAGDGSGQCAGVRAKALPDGPQDAWFAKLGSHVADILHEAGVPYCKGGVMAKNPQWRGSVATWRERIAHWIGRSRPDDLLAVDIFFDMLGVHGDTAMTETIWREAFDAAKGQSAFAKLLADAVGFDHARARPVRTHPHRAGPHRRQEDRVCSGSSARHGRWRSAITWSNGRRPRGSPGIRSLGYRRQATISKRLLDAQGTFLDLLAAQQVQDLRARHLAVQCRRGAATVAPRSRAAGAGARGRHPPRRTDARSSVSCLSRRRSRLLPHVLLVDHADMRRDHVPAVGKLHPGLHLPADLARHGLAVKQRRGHGELAAIGGDDGLGDGAVEARPASARRGTRRSRRSRRGFPMPP